MGTTASSFSRRAALHGIGGGLAMGLGASLATGAARAQEAVPAALTVQQVSLGQAQAAIAAAIADAEARGLRMVVAVVDAGANLVAFVRMDGAWLASVDVAIKKARTSALLQAPSSALGPLVQPGAPLYGAEQTSGGLVTFPGGLPLTGDGGAVIGAIGVSGSTVEDDEAVAQVGVAALGGDIGTPTAQGAWDRLNDFAADPTTGASCDTEAPALAHGIATDFATR